MILIRVYLKLSVSMISRAYLLETECLFTQGSRPVQIFGESVGGILEMDSYDWSRGIRYHIFYTRPDTEFETSTCEWFQGVSAGKQRKLSCKRDDWKALPCRSTRPR